jgi:hypothetical protein
MLAQIRDYLKTLGVASHYSVGVIDHSKDKSLGVYGRTGLARVEAMGLDATYDVAGVNLLLHWTKNAVESEVAARILYNRIRYIKETAMGDVYVYFVQPDYGEPVALGPDDNGVYEHSIPMRVYYRR